MTTTETKLLDEIRKRTLDLVARVREAADQAEAAANKADPSLAPDYLDDLRKDLRRPLELVRPLQDVALDSRRAETPREAA
jgi:hypothetical protein